MDYSLRPSQVLEPSKFENLWEETTNDGQEHLLTKMLARGELTLSDMFKGFQTIANLGVHVFLYYSQLELSLSAKKRLVSKTKAIDPTGQVDLQRCHGDLPTSPDTAMASGAGKAEGKFG